MEYFPKNYFFEYFPVGYFQVYQQEHEDATVYLTGVQTTTALGTVVVASNYIEIPLSGYSLGTALGYCRVLMEMALENTGGAGQIKIAQIYRDRPKLAHFQGIHVHSHTGFIGITIKDETENEEDILLTIIASNNAIEDQIRNSQIVKNTESEDEIISAIMIMNEALNSISTSEEDDEETVSYLLSLLA